MKRSGGVERRVKEKRKGGVKRKVGVEWIGLKLREAVEWRGEVELIEVK